MLLLCLLPARASAAESVASGSCGSEGDGSNLTWTLDSDGTLTISGTGTMADYYGSSAPWYSYQSQCKALVIENGVTRIGDRAFYNCTGRMINVQMVSRTVAPDGSVISFNIPGAWDSEFGSWRIILLDNGYLPVTAAINT